MLWFKRQPNANSESDRGDIVAPVVLAVAMDERIFVQKFAVLQEMIGELGGIEAFMEALGNKSRFFQSLLDPVPIKELNREKLELLLETVMPARKRLWPALAKLDEQGLISSVRELLYGKDELETRLNVFVDRVPEDPDADKKTNKKLKRAAHDFAAELLHFRSPEQYPLMTKWVWDQGTLSGAVRELLKGGDTLNHIPLGTGPGVYEAARVWIAEQMAAQGVYREAHYLVDLFLAHAYADYMRAMSSGMGLMNADFGGKADPMEIVKKLLGIDEARRKDSRVRKAVMH